jgi:hypothetical protein
MIITSWVDKYRVTQNQKSTIVLLNDFSSIIYQKLMLTEFWLVHKNTLSNQNIQFKGFQDRLSGIALSFDFVNFGYNDWLVSFRHRIS